MSPSHVAVLVPSVVKAADYLRTFGYEIGDVDSFEETKEIYVQGDAQACAEGRSSCNRHPHSRSKLACRRMQPVSAPRFHLRREL